MFLTINIIVLTFGGNMLIENFEFQDNEIPFITFSRDTKKNTLNKNIPTLSHMHREMEILLVLEGEAVFAANGIEYIIKKGDIVTVSPYVIHNYTILADRDFKHNCLCFDLDLLYLKELKTDLEKGLLVTPFVFRDAKCFSLAEEAFHLNEDRKEGWKLRIIGNLSVFFGLMQENSLLIKSTNYLKKNICRDIMEFISKNYMCDITSHHIATELHINHSYFCRLFKRCFGCPFQKYLCIYRIEKAKSALKNSALSVSQIAADVGFNSLSYFGKIFKETTNYTPLQYRNIKE